MKKKNIISENYLERVPLCGNIAFSLDNEKNVTLEIINRGIFNRIAQTLFKKPKTSYVHLDALGSFVWQKIDGKKNIIEIGNEVKEHFGDEANPLYERLAKYFQILESYGFISFKG